MLEKLEARAAARKAKARKVRESEVERSLVASDDQDQLTMKFVSPGRRGVPDRIQLKRVPPIHREIVASYLRFIEVKAPGKKPRPEQLREHERLRDLGFSVDVIDNKD